MFVLFYGALLLLYLIPADNIVTLSKDGTLLLIRLTITSIVPFLPSVVVVIPGSESEVVSKSMAKTRRIKAHAGFVQG